jgi:hypothetical protein
MDIGEHPRLYSELDGSSNDRANNLGPEHCPRGDLHVVSELEVRSKRECLGHGDVTPRLEHHHCDRATGEHESDYQFSDDTMHTQ